MLKRLFSTNRQAENSNVDTTPLKDMLHAVISTLVDEPGKIEIAEHEENDGVVFELKVAKGDLGKVIGKKGRTASALRTLLSAASRKHDTSAYLKIVE
jgi:predicted RNA-binding protein YlqC (UPF0109 family)